MEINFDQISNLKELIINDDSIEKLTVGKELRAARRMLIERTTKCSSIQPLYTKIRRYKPYKMIYRFFCICPRRYRSHYCCRHHGKDIIIDRDMLTREEHICHLATPKPNFAIRRLMPQFYHKRVIVPDCTTRIAELALPRVQRVHGTLELHQRILKKRQYRALQKYLKQKSQFRFLKLTTALEYIEEEQRLQRIQQRREIMRCKRIRKRIISSQRRQIRKIICFLFEEMKELLLNDQFFIDEKSTLCAVLLEQIRDFTDRDFFTTTNLRQYQQVFANNLTVWINTFISNLNINVAPTQQKRTERPQMEAFLPVSNYISHVSDENMGSPTQDGIPFPEEAECGENTTANRGG